MKKYCIVFGFLFIIILTAVFTAQSAGSTQTEYLRMHVRAASDSAADQAVKYEVKDAVVEYLIPLAAQCESKGEAMEMLAGVLDEIEAVANEVLAENGFSYTARAQRHARGGRVRRAHRRTGRWRRRELVVRDLSAPLLFRRGDGRKHPLPLPPVGDRAELFRGLRAVSPLRAILC